MKAIYNSLNLLIVAVLTMFLAHTLLAPLIPSADELKSGTVLLAIGIFAYRLLFVRYPKSSLHDGLTINDTSYAGSVLEQFISYAATQFDTLRKGCMNVLGGIKKEETVPSLSVDAFIQAHQETPTHGGDIDVGGKKLKPEDFMGYLEFNPRKFESHWLAAKMNPKLLDAKLPKTAESAIIQAVLKANAGYLDRAVWRSERDEAAIATAKANGLSKGDNNLIFINGLQRKMFLDNSVYRDGSPVALAEGNIVGKLENLAAQFSSEVYDDPNFKFLIAGANRQTYGDAQKAQSNKGVDFTQGGKQEFDGKPIVYINGMSANTIWAGKASPDIMSNLWLGVNDIDEETYLKLMPLANNSEKWFIKMLFKMDVNYGLPEEMALHMTETYD